MKNKYSKIGLFVLGLGLFTLSMLAPTQKAKAYVPKPTTTCESYCPNTGLGCILVYDDGTLLTCVDAHS